MLNLNVQGKHVQDKNTIIDCGIKVTRSAKWCFFRRFGKKPISRK